MSPTTLHTLLIDLPIALVVGGPLLFVAATVGKKCNRALTVPAVILSVVGMSSLFAFYLNTYTVRQQGGNATQELLWHLHELVHITVGTLFAAVVLFVGSVLFCRLMIHRLNNAAVRVSSIIFAVAYAIGCVWLLVVAHQGANLADHLASHAGP